ncbi:MAG: pyridoxal phosphate-dependent aminotransferase [Proteobacteria bacterium]|nr:pyridoxal phosphate-dependent aminotransferase [Pseudomonadota bacterium]
MSLLSTQVSGYLERASWIRKMFEKGAELKALHGAENVFDFSLGNPDLPPPPAMSAAIHAIADDATKPFAFGYMPNAGYPDARAALAKKLTVEQATPISPDDLVITCGAAGAINAFYRAVLEPGDEILTPAPFFVEYGFYAENHGGVLKPVPAKPLTFALDLEAMDAAITERTRVVLINSPNNPTGAVYSKAELEGLVAILEKHNKGRAKPIFLLSDEPYRFLTYDGIEVPPLLSLYPHTVIGSSFSKNLSLAGERVGYCLVNPAMPGKGELLAGLVLTNRILGFVNAPAIGQKLMMRTIDSQVDASVYAGRRAAMAKVLDNAGVNYTMPAGAFYFFPEAPGGDDLAFCNALQDELILAVPGRGFGTPGYVRLAFCTGTKVIEAATDGFKRAADKVR